MAAYKNITLVGASGKIGTMILNGLLSSGKFNITALSRQESNATFPTGVIVRKTDFTASDLEAAFKGQDAVISALGVAGFAEQQKIVDAAVRAGVKRFLPSEFSASSDDPAVLSLLPLFGQKKRLVEYLKTKESEGLTWTGVATGLLFDWGLKSGFLGFDLSAKTAIIWDKGSKNFTLTNEKLLGDAVASVLENPEKTANRFLYVYSVVTTQNEILKSLEKATGSKWTVDSTTTEHQVTDSRKKLAAGDFSGALGLVRATAFSNTPGLRSDYSKEENLANEVLGLKTETVDETVTRVV